jgi:hypothetical protein
MELLPLNLARKMIFGYIMIPQKPIPYSEPFITTNLECKINLLLTGKESLRDLPKTNMLWDLIH